MSASGNEIINLDLGEAAIVFHVDGSRTVYFPSGNEGKVVPENSPEALVTKAVMALDDDDIQVLLNRKLRLGA